MAKRPDVRSSLEKTAEKLDRRFNEVEAMARENRQMLDVQFKRIAEIQGQLDRLVAALKRPR